VASLIKRGQIFIKRRQIYCLQYSVGGRVRRVTTGTDSLAVTVVK
jgi:hypothetical protein